MLTISLQPPFAPLVRSHLALLLNPVEKLSDLLPALAEPLGEQRVAVDLHKLATRVLRPVPNCHLVRHPPCQGCFTGPWRTVEEDHAVEGAYGGVYTKVRGSEGDGGVGEEAGF